jgi:predicted dehydrogenase
MGRSRPQSALVVGAGSIGRRHLGNLQRLQIPRLLACDPNPDRVSYVHEHFGAEGVSDIEAGLSRHPDVVLICTPPNRHVKQTLLAVREGAHVFVEKPLSDSAAGLDELIAQEQKSGAIVQVGYNLRFHPPVMKLKELVAGAAVGKILWGRIEAGSYLPDWRPWQDYRQSYTSRRECGGGIILDGSHELDYAAWLFGTPAELACMAGKVSSLDINVEDCATVLLRFSNGSQIDVHLDFMERFYNRGCVLAGESGKLQWDFTANSIQIDRVGEERETIGFDSEVNDMYVAEMQHFLDCVESGEKPEVTLQEGIRTLQIALAARQAAEERRWVSLG